MSRPPVIRLYDASKRYRLLKQKPYLLHEVVKRMTGRRTTRQDFWALDGVSFEVQAGESVAIIGRNGAGKSTLLGLIAGALTPTRGTIDVQGRLGVLLELGAGFHPDLTGRENIYLNASLLGLDRPEVEACFEQIVEFSELADFIDSPLRNYSSGMQVRLGFSVAAHIHPEILIVDEALSVGDAKFKQKCMARINAFREAGKTLLFVSHDVTQVEKICSRAIWLDHGQLAGDGPVADVLKRYLEAR